MDHQPHLQPSSTHLQLFAHRHQPSRNIPATLSATREERREEEARELTWKEKRASRQPRRTRKIINPLPCVEERVAGQISNVAER